MFICQALLAYVLLNNILALPQKNKDLKTFIDNYLTQPLIIATGKDDDIVLDNLERPKILINIEKELDNFELAEVVYSYILIERSQSHLDLTLSKLRSMRIWNSRSKFLVIFQNPVSKTDMSESLLLLFNYNVYNAVLHTNQSNFYTIWYPYQASSNCGTKTNLVKIKNRDPYANKIPKKFPNCFIKVTWNNMLMVLYDPFNQTNPGAMVKVLGLLEEKLDVTFVYEKNNTEYIDEFYSSNGFLDLVEDMNQRGIDVTVYFKAEINCVEVEIPDLENSVRIIYQHFYLVLPPRFQINTHAVSHFLLLGIITTILVMSLFLKKLTGEPFLSFVIKLFQLSFQQPIFAGIPKRRSVRILFVSYLIYNIYIYAAYQTGLSVVSTHPVSPAKIRTFEEFVKTGTKAVCHVGVKCTLETKGEPVYDELSKRIIEKDVPMLESMGDFLENPKDAICISSLHLFYFKNSDKLDVLTWDKINTIYYQLGVRRGFPLLPSINDWLDNIKETGHVEKYLRDSTERNLTVKNLNTWSGVEVGFRQLAGTILGYCVGMITSIIVFLRELYRKKK